MRFINPINPLSQTRLVLLAAAFMVISGNWAFFEKFIEVYPWGSENAGFLISLAIMLGSILVLLMALLGTVFPTRVIALLKANIPRFKTTMLYVSDHGEPLDEKRLYLHGIPYLFAPREQTEVPVIVWFGDGSDVEFISANR